MLYVIYYSINRFMITSLLELKLYLKEDAKRNGMGKKTKYYLGLLYGNEKAIIVRYLRLLRKTEYYANTSKTIFGRLMALYYRIRLRRNGIKHNLLIVINSTGYGLRIPHIIGGGVIINCKQMGNNCDVNTGVIIGNKNSIENRPIIGDNVKIMLGAKVYGRIIIGDNAIIAPNAVVCNDVESNQIVGGIPAKPIKR